MGVFTFKKFSVVDDLATMKVGTDAVLLGAWAPVDSAKTILDIGTGSGVISLILAQRTTDDTTIDAVELQEMDARQASENIAKSPWPGKIQVFNTDIKDFMPMRTYDLIVCNPPFFAHSLLPPSAERSKARHQQTLTPDDLITHAHRLLSTNGRLCIIMPAVEGEWFIHTALTRRLFLQHFTRFYTRVGKPQERSLLLFGMKPGIPKEDSLTLYAAGDQWSSEYQQLTLDFYLER